MDKCKGCLMLREVRKLKVEVISFLDSEEKPRYCRKCYQDERAENAKLKEVLELIVGLLEHPACHVEQRDLNKAHEILGDGKGDSDE